MALLLSGDVLDEGNAIFPQMHSISARQPIGHTFPHSKSGSLDKTTKFDI